MSDDGSGSFIDDDSLNDFSDFSGGEGQAGGGGFDDEAPDFVDDVKECTPLQKPKPSVTSSKATTAKGVAAKPAAQKKTKGSNKTKSSIKKQQDQGGVGEPCEAPIANLPEPPSSLPGPEGLVWAYMRHTNRPYSVVNVCDNLHKQVPRALAQSILDKLVARGDLRVKVYGKTSIYYQNQETLEKSLGDVSDEAITSLGQEGTERQAILSKLTAEYQARESLNKSVALEPTDEELEEQLLALTEENNADEARLSKLESQQVGLNPKAFQNSCKEFNEMRVCWMDRKRKCIDMIDMVADGMEKKTNQVFDIMGLENDDLQGVIPSKL